MMLDPKATPVTSPFASTVAMVGLRLDHVIFRPVSLFPLASLVSMENPMVFPRRTESAEFIPTIDATFLGSAASFQAAMAMHAIAAIVRAARAERRACIDG